MSSSCAQRRFRQLWLAGLLLTALPGLSLTAEAAARDLHASTGHGGGSVTPTAISADHVHHQDTSANAIAIDSAGRIVVAGETTHRRGEVGVAFVLVRYEYDGTLDRRFGSGGEVTTFFPTRRHPNAPRSFAQAEAMAIDPAGRIIVAGSSGGAFALARYRADGKLDPTFGNGGRVTTGVLSGAGSQANAVALGPRGKIVAAGYACGYANGSDPCFALTRYNPDGSLDTTFGSRGRVTTNIGLGAAAYGVAVDPAGRIVAAGFRDAFPEGGLALTRYNRDGSLDSTFGSGGVATSGFGASAIAIDPAARIVAAGATGAAGLTDFAISRYEEDGSLDPGFGRGGQVTTSFYGLPSAANAVALDPAGRIIAAGTSDSDFALARYSPDGSLDSAFGSAGQVRTDFEPFGAAQARGVATDDAGGTIAVGSACCDAEQNRYIALARYNPNGSLDPGFGSGGRVTTALPPSTRITKGKVAARKRRAQFRFEAIGPATGLRCALRSPQRDRPKFKRCESPKTYKHLTPGSYTFEVRAFGPGGRDQSPAKRKFRIPAPPDN